MKIRYLSNAKKATVKQEQLIKKIREKVKRGMPPGEIASYLSEQSFSPGLIKQVVDEFHKTLPKVPEGKFLPEKYKGYTLAGSCCLITGLALGSVSTLSFLLVNIFILAGLALLIPWLLSTLKK